MPDVLTAVGQDGLVVRVDFLRPQYHGLTGNSEPEWPPAPLRLVGALLAGAHSLLDEAKRSAAVGAIRALCARPAPIILVPRTDRGGIPRTFTQRTGHPKGLAAGAVGAFLDSGVVGLSSTAKEAKPQGFRVMDGSQVFFLVPAAARLREALAPAASATPYFGRSMDLCDISVGGADSLGEVVDARGRIDPRLRALHPLDTAQRAANSGATRSWHEDSVDWYDANYEILTTHADQQSIPATGFARPVLYREIDSDDPEGVLVIPIKPTVPARIGRAFMDGELSSRLPAGWSGFVCVRSARSHADGQAVGVGLVAPHGASSEQRRDAVRSVAKAVPGVDAASASGRMWTSARYWSRRSRRWISATPLRAFPDVRVLDYSLSEQLRREYGVGAELVRAETRPVVPWQSRWPRQLESGDGLGQWWVELKLDAELPGPLLLGADIERGFGLFAPMSEEGE